MSENNSRRGFLATSATALAGLTLAPGIRLIEIAAAKPDNEPVSAKVRRPATRPPSGNSRSRQPRSKPITRPTASAATKPAAPGGSS